LERFSTHLEDSGSPIFSRQSVGETGTGTACGGYSLINADNPEEACELAAGCPLVSRGRGVEIGEVTPLSEVNPPLQASCQATVA
jgi:hypothetical protein